MEIRVSAVHRLWNMTHRKTKICYAAEQQRYTLLPYFTWNWASALSHSTRLQRTDDFPLAYFRDRFDRSFDLVTAGVTHPQRYPETRLCYMSIPRGDPRRMPREVKARQRVSQACIPCGQRKIKVFLTMSRASALVSANLHQCNGTSPVCNQCADSFRRCHYGISRRNKT